MDETLRGGAWLADTFEVLARERRHDGFLKLDRYTLRQRRFDGGISPILHREVMMAGEAVAVILYDPRLDRVVLIEQARLPAAIAGFAPLSIEVVAGLIEPGEAPEAVARREILEETGLDAIGEIVPIIHMLVSPGNTNQTLDLFCARVDSSLAGGHHGVAEEHEDIRSVVYEFEDFQARIADGRIDNAIALVAGYWLIANRARLREMWP